jgi:hypothetical protein
VSMIHSGKVPVGMGLQGYQLKINSRVSYILHSDISHVLRYDSCTDCVIILLIYCRLILTTLSHNIRMVTLQNKSVSVGCGTGNCMPTVPFLLRSLLYYSVK